MTQLNSAFEKLGFWESETEEEHIAIFGMDFPSEQAYIIITDDAGNTPDKDYAIWRDARLKQVNEPPPGAVIEAGPFSVEYPVQVPAAVLRYYRRDGQARSRVAVPDIHAPD